MTTLFLLAVMMMPYDAVRLSFDGPTPVGRSCRIKVDRCLILLQIGGQGNSPLVLLREEILIHPNNMVTLLTLQLLTPRIWAIPSTIIASSFLARLVLPYHEIPTAS